MVALPNLTLPVVVRMIVSTDDTFPQKVRFPVVSSSPHIKVLRFVAYWNASSDITLTSSGSIHSYTPLAM